jgi:uracil-DNA glycosylase
MQSAGMKPIDLKKYCMSNAEYSKRPVFITTIAFCRFPVCRSTGKNAPIKEIGATQTPYLLN